MNTATLATTTLPLDDSFGAGTHSSRLIARTFIVYSMVFLLGLLPSLLGWSAVWQTAGLGLVFPGGGFVALGGWWLIAFALTVVLMLAACALWQLMANVFAPLFIWIGSLLLAATLAEESVWPAAQYLVPLIALAFLGWATWKTRAISARELKNREARNAYLPRAEQQVLARAVPAPAPGTRELSPEEIAHLRYVLERALQPVESFGGFDVIEQFQTSALRYQINSLLWALQVAQCHYTPNFHGYLSQAQRNLIDKLTVPIVWKWWRWENLFGNFSFGKDPIAKDNIMFAGFSSANVALYTANTGDDHYLKDGSLCFRENAKTSYRHSLKTMIENGRWNQRIAEYGPLYPCEPTLTYSACNVWGNFQHVIADRLFGTNNRQELIDKLRIGHITEMMTHDGVPHSGRVNPLGIRLPVYSCNMVSALWGWMANTFFPDLARRVYAILREEAVHFDANGEITLTTFAYDRVDTGNYKKSEVGLYAHMLIYAREMGDDEVANALVRKLAKDFNRIEDNGVVAYKNVSTRESGSIVLGVLMRGGDLSSMVHRGPPAGAMRGPLLSEVTYPGVLVAKAFSNGDDLNLVLYPGARETRQTLGLSRLNPGGTYAVTGVPGMTTATADSNGKATIAVELTRRTEIGLKIQA
jgi:Linalool dehydratase/isomerase